MTAPLSRLPPTWARINRATANHLLRAEASTLADLRSHLRRATKTVAYAVGTGNASGAGGQLVLLGSIQAAAGPLADGVVGAIQAGRARARRLAGTRLDVELSAVESMTGVSIARPAPAQAADDGSARRIAGTFTTGWARAVSVDFTATDITPTKITKASTEQDFRLRRIAATENARAYSEAHAVAAHTVAARHRGQPWARGVFRRWDAILDKHVCKVCRAMDGQMVPWGTAFAHNYEPGSVHPCCRCFDTILGLRAEMPAPEPVPVTDVQQGAIIRRRAMTSTATQADTTPWGGGGGDWGGGGSSGSY